MNDTINYMAADTIGKISADTVVEALNQYKDFKFITESSGVFEGSKEREVLYVSAGWNFTIMFVMMVLIALNKFFAPQRFASIITMPFQSGGGDKMVRENHSFLNFISLSIIVSFNLLPLLSKTKVNLLDLHSFLIKNLRTGLQTHYNPAFFSFLCSFNFFFCFFFYFFSSFFFYFFVFF